MVKNMLVLRFGNPMFGAVWDCNHIDNVQVDPLSSRLTAHSDYALDINVRRYRHRWPRWLFRRCGSDSRYHAKPYDSAVRVAQINRLSYTDLTQILALITMERPGSFSAEDLRQEKVSCTLSRNPPRAYVPFRPASSASCRLSK